MMSFRTISIYPDGADFYQPVVPIAASLLTHVIASGIIGFAIMYTPRVVNSAQGERYIVRHLEMDPTEPRTRRPPSGPNHDDQTSTAIASNAVGERMAAYLHKPAQIRAAKPGAQVLVQPDIPPNLKFHDEIPVPTLVAWTPSNTTAKTIAPPKLEETRSANVTPSVTAPNEELAVKELALPASDLPAKKDQLLPATTSPLVVNKTDAMQKPPVTVSQAKDKLAPAPILSISDFRTKDRSAILPPINEIAGSKTPSELRGDKATNPSLQSNDHLGGNPGETRQGQDSGNSHSAQERPNLGASETYHSGPGQENKASLFGGSQGSATVITVAKDGRFGAVVVGSSVEDRFPELEGLWSGRLIYTVYLRVGLAQSWILQYSLPRSAEAAAAGNIAHLEAPWPYSIVRPDLAVGSVEADALIVNGFIDQDGRFEALKLVVPPSFPQSDFVLRCLRQWQFRPAAQGGHPTRVEVMLIIPDSQ